MFHNINRCILKPTVLYTSSLILDISGMKLANCKIQTIRFINRISSEVVAKHGTALNLSLVYSDAGMK